MDAIPQELINHVVDFVNDDHQTLRATRLVSRSWNISARAHFFHQLDLLIPRPPLTTTCAGDKSSSHLPATKSENRNVDRFKKLLDILNSSPDIAYFVREVIIGKTTGLNPTQWHTYDHLLSEIVAHLKQVTTIHIREVNWSQISPSFITSLIALFDSPQLQCLDLWNCQVPSIQVLIDFLNSSCTLVGLRLSHIRSLNDLEGAKALLSTPRVIDKSKRPNKKPLQRLYIEAVPLALVLSALLTTIPCSIDITKLQSLLLNHIDDISSARNFLQVAGGSLESLEIWASTFQSRCSIVQGTIDLNQAPRLKYLRVSGLQWAVGMCPAECLLPIFQHISNVHSLESLDVVTITRKPKSHKFNFTQWSFLDEILSRPVFPALQKVKIAVYSPSPFMSFSPTEVDQLANAFPRLQANRKIHVICK